MEAVLNIMCGITGEMAVNSIPIAPGVDIAALKAGDDNPLEIVVEIPATKSKRGWNYTEAAIKDIVNKVNTDTLNGFKGHQKPENIATEFPDIQTHWIGAVWNDTVKKGYFRGVMDKNAKQLKDWIKTGRIKQVSIFGKPTLEKDNNGNINVTRYDPMSIDWTPLDRPGMPTQIVAKGEMTQFSDSFCNKLDFNGILDTNISSEIFNSAENKGGNSNMAGENQNTNNANNTPAKLSKSELLIQLRDMYINGEMKDADLEESILKFSQSKIIKEDVKKAIGEMTAADITAAIAAKSASDIEAATKGKAETIAAVIKEKVTGEQAIKFVTEVFTTNETEKDKIAGEMDEFLKKDMIKNTINAFTNTGSTNHSTNNSNNGGTGNVGYLEDNKYLKPKY